MVKYAIDCEMVGSGNKSILARVSIVNENGMTVLDEYVKPTAQVTDYRTCVSGIKRTNLQNGREFSTIKQKVQSLISGCILIGHSLHFDLDALGLSHPEHMRRDLAQYEPFKRLNNGQPASLQFLARQYLGRYIQEGEHDSVQDAKACMDIYRQVASNWERLY
ncbi:RNA exonuclease 4 [Maniola jurtina]|uniref:RNA exonuclease 4 n=1 Tax=Maniola jurtina TaxID=191418 RepID=UPI001E68F638|nr:RNA exonuclease 4 [Maniola jurtina]XP_045777583.1 RNA exonuclease 4 [Maniola jurtina]